MLPGPVREVDLLLLAVGLLLLVVGLVEEALEVVQVLV